MLTKDYFDKHFKLHNKLVLFSKDNIPITITKEYHFAANGGHRSFTLQDSEDLADFCRDFNLSIQPHENIH